jgi:hypothetical protein
MIGEGTSSSVFRGLFGFGDFKTYSKFTFATVKWRTRVPNGAGSREKS